MSIKSISTLKPDDVPFKLPNNWSWYKLGDIIAEYQQGLIRANRELNGIGVPYLKMNNLDNDGGYNLNKLEFTEVTDEEIKRYNLYKGDFLLNVRNSKELVGKTCVIGSHEFDIVYNHMLVRIKFHEGIAGSYINALLKTPVMRKFIDRCKKGTTTVIALYQKDLYEIPIPIPDTDTHNSIVSIVENLSRKIELNNCINVELEAMAKTLYDYWFVQFDFPDKDVKPYKTSGGEMIWNEGLKREIPAGWEVGILSDLGDIIGGSTPSKENLEYFSNQGTAWITPKDLSMNGDNKFISKGEIDVSDKGLKAASLKIMPKGTILLSSRAPVGYMAIARDLVTTNQGFKSFVPKADYSTPFIFYTIKNSLPEIVNNASGSTFKEISGGTLKTIKTCLPEKLIINNFTDKVSPIFERQNVLELENQQLASLRDWLLPMLMNGQVRVGDSGEKKVEYEVEEEMRMAAEPEE